MNAALLTIAKAAGLTFIIAISARKTGLLTDSGALAAFCGGTIAILAGWDWAFFLMLWFAMMAIVSQLGRRAKVQHTQGMVEKGGQRDIWQVLANGGVFFLLAAIGVLVPVWKTNAAVLAAASLTAAGADSAATEIGTWLGGTPRSLRTLRPVSAGTSGAVSVLGSLAMFLAAAIITWIAVALHMATPTQTPIVFFAAIAGSIADTILGATLQARRQCPACSEPTEQLVHHCGTPSCHSGGISWMTNDTINALATTLAAVVALLLIT